MSNNTSTNMSLEELTAKVNSLENRLEITLETIVDHMFKQTEMLAKIELNENKK